jgi:hypothetical protein
MTKHENQSPVVMLNLGLMEIRLDSVSFQHLISFFLPSADTPFIPVPAYRQAGTGRGFQVRLLINFDDNPIRCHFIHPNLWYIFLLTLSNTIE